MSHPGAEGERSPRTAGHQPSLPRAGAAGPSPAGTAGPAPAARAAASGAGAAPSAGSGAPAPRAAPPAIPAPSQCCGALQHQDGGEGRAVVPGHGAGVTGPLRVASRRAAGVPSSSLGLQLLVTCSTSGCLRFSSSMNTCVEQGAEHPPAAPAGSRHSREGAGAGSADPPPWDPPAPPTLRTTESFWLEERHPQGH